MANIEKRQHQGGVITYRVKIRLKGTPTQTATFERLTDARRWAQQTEAAIKEGCYFKTNEARKHTLAKAIERYRRDVLPNKPKSLRDQSLQLKWWEQCAGHYALADLTPAVIAEKRDYLAQETTTRGKSSGRL